MKLLFFECIHFVLEGVPVVHSELTVHVCVSLSFSRHHLHSVAAQPGLHHRMECQVQTHPVTETL